MISRCTALGLLTGGQCVRRPALCSVSCSLPLPRMAPCSSAANEPPQPAGWGRGLRLPPPPNVVESGRRVRLRTERAAEVGRRQLGGCGVLSAAPRRASGAVRRCRGSRCIVIGGKAAPCQRAAPGPAAILLRCCK